MADIKWVMYKGEIHTVLKEYDSGMVEIREVNGHNVKLIEKKNLMPMNTLNKKDANN